MIVNLTVKEILQCIMCVKLETELIKLRRRHGEKQFAYMLEPLEEILAKLEASVREEDRL